MQEWEYLVVDREIQRKWTGGLKPEAATETTNVLNEAGADGWELVSVTPLDLLLDGHGGTGVLRMFFKRPK